MEKNTISISIPEQLIKKLDSKSSEIGINRSAYMTMILFDYFKKEELMKNLPDMLSNMTNLSKNVKELNDMKKLMDNYEQMKLEKA